MAAVAGPAAAWRLEHYLLADVWQAAAGSKKPHPGLPDRKQLAGSAGRRDSARTDALLRAQQRRIDRAARLAADPAATD